jgi:hypothetical protein
LIPLFCLLSEKYQAIRFAMCLPLLQAGHLWTAISALEGNHLAFWPLQILSNGVYYSGNRLVDLCPNNAVLGVSVASFENGILLVICAVIWSQGATICLSG